MKGVIYHQLGTRYCYFFICFQKLSIYWYKKSHFNQLIGDPSINDKVLDSLKFKPSADNKLKRGKNDDFFLL